MSLAELPVLERARAVYADGSLLEWRPLNGLQRMMLRWEQFCPLNAAHVLTLSGSVTASLLGDAVRAALGRHFPLPAEVCTGGNRMRCGVRLGQGGDVELTVSSVHRQPELAIAGVLDRELNRYFPGGLHWPFRFHAICETADRWHLVVVYRHAFMDSRGISALCRSVLRVLRGFELTEPAPGFAPDLSSIVPAFSDSAAARHSVVSVSREIFHGLGSWRAQQRFAGPDRCVTGVESESLSLSGVLQSARSLGVTVQDLLLAAMHDSLSQMSLVTGRRQRIGLYTPVDLRQETVPPVPEASGQVLGGYTLRLPRERGGSFADLAKRVSRESQAIKRSGHYRLYERHLSFMTAVWDRLSHRANEVAGPFLAPVAALASNVNLNVFFEDELQSGQLLDYSRYTGTGIMTSMMVGLTTCGANCRISTTHHSTLFAESEIRELRRRVCCRLLGEFQQL
jgi:phage protein U